MSASSVSSGGSTCFLFLPASGLVPIDVVVLAVAVVVVLAVAAVVVAVAAVGSGAGGTGVGVGSAFETLSFSLLGFLSLLIVELCSL